MGALRIQYICQGGQNFHKFISDTQVSKKVKVFNNGDSSLTTITGLQYLTEWRPIKWEFKIRIILNDLKLTFNILISHGNYRENQKNDSVMFILGDQHFIACGAHLWKQ